MNTHSELKAKRGPTASFGHEREMTLRLFGSSFKESFLTSFGCISVALLMSLLVWNLRGAEVAISCVPFVAAASVVGTIAYRLVATRTPLLQRNTSDLIRESVSSLEESGVDAVKIRDIIGESSITAGVDVKETVRLIQSLVEENNRRLNEYAKTIEAIRFQIEDWKGAQTAFAAALSPRTSHDENLAIYKSIEAELVTIKMLQERQAMQMDSLESTVQNLTDNSAGANRTGSIVGASAFSEYETVRSNLETLLVPFKFKLANEILMRDFTNLTDAIKRRGGFKSGTELFHKFSLYERSRWPGLTTLEEQLGIVDIVKFEETNP